MRMKVLCLLFISSFLSFCFNPNNAQTKEEIKRELKKYTLQLEPEKREEFLNKLGALDPEKKEQFLKNFYKKVTQFKEQEESLIQETWKDTPSRERREMVRDFGKFIVAPSGGSLLDTLLEAVPQEFLDEAEGFIRQLSEDPEVQKIVEALMDFQQMSREEKRELIQTLLREAEDQLKVALHKAEDHLEVFLNDAELALEDVKEQVEIALKDAGKDLDKGLFRALIKAKKMVQRQKEYTRNLRVFWKLPESTQQQLLKLSPKERQNALNALQHKDHVAYIESESTETALVSLHPTLGKRVPSKCKSGKCGKAKAKKGGCPFSKARGARQGGPIRQMLHKKLAQRFHAHQDSKGHRGPKAFHKGHKGKCGKANAGCKSRKCGKAKAGCKSGKCGKAKAGCKSGKCGKANAKKGGCPFSKARGARQGGPIRQMLHKKLAQRFHARQGSKGHRGPKAFHKGHKGKCGKANAKKGGCPFSKARGARQGGPIRQMLHKKLAQRFHAHQGSKGHRGPKAFHKGHKGHRGPKAFHKGHKGNRGKANAKKGGCPLLKCLRAHSGPIRQMLHKKLAQHFQARKGHRGPKAFHKGHKGNRGPRGFHKGPKGHRGPKAFHKGHKGNRGPKGFHKGPKGHRSPKGFHKGFKGNRGPRGFHKGPKGHRGPKGFHKGFKGNRGPKTHCPFLKAKAFKQKICKKLCAKVKVRLHKAKAKLHKVLHQKFCCAKVHKGHGKKAPKARWNKGHGKKAPKARWNKGHGKKASKASVKKKSNKKAKWYGGNDYRWNKKAAPKKGKASAKKLHPIRDVIFDLDKDELMKLQKMDSGDRRIYIKKIMQGKGPQGGMHRQEGMRPQIRMHLQEGMHPSHSEGNLRAEAEKLKNALENMPKEKVPAFIKSLDERHQRMARRILNARRSSEQD